MKLLVANRGEIAVRVVRACREMGLGSVAVYADCDREALHVRMADEAVAIGASPPAESYLNIGRLVDAARCTGAALVHPGYGFLAENAAFAQACADAGLTFVGPTADAIRRMGDKHEARRAARLAGVPVVPGSDAVFAADAPDQTICTAADALGYPVLVKAVAGGGGKGMRTVDRREDLPSAIRMARSEARSAFGDDAVYLERKLDSPRHVEIQLLGDHDGTTLPFVERECSIQRRHQKIVEESPSAAIDPGQRREMAAAAARIAATIGYTNAGTIEFLLDAQGRFYFLEMNTRLQVEHPVTEAVTGIDLVQWQIRIARGERLELPADRAMTPRGHAIECRIYAEDPDRGFLPSPGLVRAMRVPGGPGVRDDGGVTAGSMVPVFYDPLIAKLVVWGHSRAAAAARLRRALDEYEVVGIRTTLPFFRWLVRQPDFLQARVNTAWLDGVLAVREEPLSAFDDHAERDAAIAAALGEWFRSRSAAVEAPRAAGAWRAARRDALR